jgi:hypothetical protein
MKNVKLEITKNILTIEVDLSKDFGPSGSGKSIMIASSEGSQSLPDSLDGIKIGLNVFRPKEAKK